MTPLISPGLNVSSSEQMIYSLYYTVSYNCRVNNVCTTSVLKLNCPSQGTDYEERLHGSANVYKIPKQLCPFYPHLTIFSFSNHF